MPNPELSLRYELQGRWRRRNLPNERWQRGCIRLVLNAIRRIRKSRMELLLYHLRKANPAMSYHNTEYLASRVADTLYLEARSDEQRAVAFDPALALLIVQILYQLAKLYIDCNYSASEAMESVAKPGVFARLRMRWVIKGAIGGTKYAGMYHDLKGAILKTAARMSLEDMQGVMRETRRRERARG